VEKRRVVVTGVGMITPVGNTTEETWNNLLKGESGAGQISRFDTEDWPVTIAHEVKDFDPLEYLEKKDLRKMDIFIHYAIAATEQAFNYAGLKIEGDLQERAGVIIGSGIGGLPIIESQHKKFLKEQNYKKISPFFIPSLIANMASGHVSIRYGLKGPNSAVITACSTSCHAVGDSFKIIQRGDADIMVAGGAESVITPLAVGGFAAARALSTRNDEPERASRPFDAERDGFVMGEGSGVLILETLESAQNRGADILAEVVGYGMSGDAYHMTAPSADGDGARRVMLNAIRDASEDPSVVDYINAHGTATPAGDVVETIAVKAAFGDHARKIAINSTKSLVGHLLGAAGGVESAVTVLSIHNQKVHPTINLENPDPDCDLDYVPGKAREMTINYGLTNSFGFGGTNAAVMFKKFEK
jgi:3-oxoacyl-[acyl-carrier-protein] synthase II